ncbi:MAG: hypothetical protein LBH14_02805 [Desulfobulbaceae bacterium]|jgi:hypothetical protein|nr:hypothetical protein [Desulfobulbaceae bacterium]
MIWRGKIARLATAQQVRLGYGKPAGGILRPQRKIVAVYSNWRFFVNSRVATPRAGVVLILPTPDRIKEAARQTLRAVHFAGVSPFD